MLYGTGGIGKSSLSCLIEKVRGKVGYIDLDNSLGVLQPRLTEYGLSPMVVEGIESWTDLRDALHSDIWAGVNNIVVDTITRAEELAVAFTLKTTPDEHGTFIDRLENYNFGKGFQHVYETFLAFFCDLDQHLRAGRNVIVIAHDISATVGNPEGESFLRYEPRLQHPSSQKSSVRMKAKEWCDNLFCILYDRSVKKKIATGGGSRTIYPRELAWCMAKSRTIQDPVVYEEGSSLLWELVFGSEANHG